MRHVNYISLTTIKEASKLFVCSYSARNYSFMTFFRSPYNHFYKAFYDFAGLNPGFKRNNGISISEILWDGITTSVGIIDLCTGISRFFQRNNEFLFYWVME